VKKTLIRFTRLLEQYSSKRWAHNYNHFLASYSRFSDVVLLSLLARAAISNLAEGIRTVEGTFMAHFHRYSSRICIIPYRGHARASVLLC